MADVGQIRVIIREIHRADVPGNPHYIASVQLVDGDWVSRVFPVDFKNLDELRRKIALEIQLYLSAKQLYGERVARM